jgi:hypothetical protein
MQKGKILPESTSIMQEACQPAWQKDRSNQKIPGQDSKTGQNKSRGRFSPELVRMKLIF